MTRVRAPSTPLRPAAGQSPAPAPTADRTALEAELRDLRRQSRAHDPRGQLTYKDMMRASQEKAKIDQRIAKLEAQLASLAPAPAPVSGPAPRRPVDEMDRSRPIRTERDMDIVCPVLGAMVASGKLQMDADGNVKLSQLRDILVHDHNLSPIMARATAVTGFAGNGPLDVLGNLLGNEMNVLELRSGMIKHPGDSAILTGGKFDQGRFDAFVAHAAPGGPGEGGRMTIESFARAVQAQADRDQDGATRVAGSGGALGWILPGGLDTVVRGQPSAVVEYSALLNVYGQTDPATGERYITTDDLLTLYRDKQLPPSARMQSRPMTGVADFATTMAKMGYETAFGTSSGTALEGAERALGAEPKGTDGMGGAGKASCPFMHGGAQKAAPMSPAENHLLHAATS